MKDKILKLRNLGFSYNEIAKKLNCSKSTISYHCSKVDDNSEKIKKNIDIKNKKQRINDSFLLNNVDIDNVIKLRKDRKTYDEIKNITKLSKSVISKICRKYGILKSRKYSKITDDDIKIMNDLYLEIGTIKGVSEKLNLDRGTVSKYIKGNVKKKKKVTPSEAVINWRRRKKIELVDYKGGKCEKCSYSKCIDALEFHHLDPDEKDFTVSGKSWSFEKLKKEVDKCILVCSNCHKEIHFEIKMQKWWNG